MKNIFRTEERTEGFYRPGVRMEEDGIRFKIAVPGKKKVSLLLYNKSNGELAAELPLSQNNGTGSIRTVKVLGLDWKEYRYQYKIEDCLTPDFYARGIWKGNDEQSRQCEMDFSSFSWGKSKKPQIPYHQGIMYHLHVRNYTMHEKSGVIHKGTFLGLQEKIPYLKKLGINQLILMPVYEFDEQQQKEVLAVSKNEHFTKKIKQQKNYWGYKPGFYFAPKKRYAATQHPSEEFKQMVKAFHEQQIEVILEFYFDKNCVLRQQIEVLKYWMEEFQIDGFRIMGDTDLARHLAGDPVFSDCKILSYYCGDLDERQMQNQNIAEMNDCFMNDMRRCLKGDEGMLESLAFRTRRNPSGYGVINYITGHDGFTLQDLVSYDQKHNEENGENNKDGCQCNFSWNCGIEGETRKRDILALRNKLKKNAMMMLLFAQGTPMILAGDEFCNSQMGNNNPYCLDNEVSWVDWGSYKKNLKFVQFVKALIAFRKSEKLLRLEKEYSFMDKKSCGYPDLSYHGSKAWYGDFGYTQRHLGMLYCGSYVQEKRFLYVLYNMHPQKRQLALPKLPENMRWLKMIDTSLKESIFQESEEIDQKEKMIEIPERSIMLLIGEQE